MLNFIRKYIEETPYLLLGLLWASVQILLFYKLGIKVVQDSHRYMSYAESMVAGSNYWYHNSSIFYSVYTSFIAITHLVLQLPIAAVVTIQTLLSGVAALLLYKATLSYSKNVHAAFFATSLYIVWPDLQMWNFYIHTESLYIFVSILTFYLLLKSNFSFKLISLVLVLTVAAFLRPNGFFLSVSVLLFLTIKWQMQYIQKYKKLKVSLEVVAVCMFMVGIAFMLEIFNPVQYYLEGQIIQGYSYFTVPLKYPDDGTATSAAYLQLLAIAVHQPIDLGRLLLCRFIFFWAQVRPYYTFVHNTVIVLFFTPIYYFALKHIFGHRLNQPGIKFILCLFTLHTAMAMFIAVDWDNRFIVPILPFIFVLASTGISSSYAAPHQHADNS